jgi:hypothetical protein
VGHKRRFRGVRDRSGLPTDAGKITAERRMLMSLGLPIAILANVHYCRRPSCA